MLSFLPFVDIIWFSPRCFHGKAGFGGCPWHMYLHTHTHVVHSLTYTLTCTHIRWKKFLRRLLRQCNTATQKFVFLETKCKHRMVEVLLSHETCRNVIERNPTASMLFLNKSTEIRIWIVCLDWCSLVSPFLSHFSPSHPSWHFSLGTCPKRRKFAIYILASAIHSGHERDLTPCDKWQAHTRFCHRWEQRWV